MPPTLLEQTTFAATSLESIDYPAVRATLAEHSIVRVHGLFDPDAVRAIKRAIAASFDPSADRKHDPRDTEAVRRNFQKLQIGAGSGIGTSRTLGRFLRVFYNPIFADDVLGMRACFVRLARFRNRLLGLPVGFAVHGTDDGLFTCARIHQYPRGGGFMVPHRDMFSQVAAVEAGLAYIQPFVLLSDKGADYQAGGGYIEHGGRHVQFEDECEAGDVVVYDGRSVHGVADIDPLEPLDLDHFGGRIAAFASLFSHLQPGETDYARMSATAAARFGDGT